MTGSLDALGGLVDAGLVATSLDDKGAAGGINAAEIADAHHECANCGRHLDGNFCSNCGQRAHVHRSVLHVGEEFLHGITHFDGKAWQTLPMLLFRPGKLTREYIMGKRVRYVAPVPLFLLVVFLMFFVFSFVHAPWAAVGGKAMTPVEREQALAKLDKNIADVDRQIGAARAAHKQDDIAGLNASRAALEFGRTQLSGRDKNGAVVNPLDFPAAVTSELKEKYDSGEIKVDLGNSTLDERARAALQNPQLALYKVQGKVYKYSFLLVPLSLPWLWLMFAFRRDVRMYDHAVFALYSISFMSLLFIIGSIALALSFTYGPFFIALVFVAPILHMYAQLKGAYNLGRAGAAWRTVALSVAAVISISLYLTLTLAIGLLD
jgi:hypothetical protein